MFVCIDPYFYLRKIHMQVHQVIPLTPQSEAHLERVIIAKCDLFWRLDPGIWLIAAQDEVFDRDLSITLGIDDPANKAPAFITTVANYYGRADADIWAWFKKNYEKGNYPAVALG
jgi:hypothetical protein